ncbi:hypothetical protein NDU88_007659 [Pleurodeles waltl]|uniref:Uncharacterized protein n=1 Tax=Pleurodeles waltl TaxID=8319 RepID=A0AAV7QPR7_PLEWA|nr:hypothetical protein NDU88_007659 [Pleurodeles waltl]
MSAGVRRVGHLGRAPCESDFTVRPRLSNKLRTADGAHQRDTGEDIRLSAKIKRGPGDDEFVEGEAERSLALRLQPILERSHIQSGGAADTVGTCGLGERRAALRPSGGGGVLPGWTVRTALDLPDPNFSPVWKSRDPLYISDPARSLEHRDKRNWTPGRGRLKSRLHCAAQIQIQVKNSRRGTPTSHQRRH